MRMTNQTQKTKTGYRGLSILALVAVVLILPLIFFGCTKESGHEGHGHAADEECPSETVSRQETPEQETFTVDDATSGEDDGHDHHHGHSHGHRH